MKPLRMLMGDLLRRSRLENDMAEELRFHIESRTNDLVGRGMTLDKASRTARMEFGAVEAHKDNCRDARGLQLIDGMRNDVRYAVRTLRKSVSFTTVAVLSLALGISVNISGFISVDSLVLRPLPYPNLNRIMTLWESVPKMGSHRDPVAPANFFDWKESSHAFEHLAAYRPWDATLTGGSDPERVEAGRVSAEFFDVLGMNPVLGRTFNESEAEPGHDSVVVISSGFWKDRLGSAADVTSKTISLGGHNYSVIGVMPPEFDFPLTTQVWAPLALTMQEKNQRAAKDLLVIGKLKPGIPLTQARAELTTVAQRLEQRYPATNEARGIVIKPVLELTNDVTDHFVLIQMCAAFFVLLLACANIGNLQMARATGRVKEIGLRTALGASRLRIARQLLIESVVMSMLAGVLGLGLASANVRYTMSAIPAQVYKWVAGLHSMEIHPSTLSVTFLLCVFVGVLCALPAIFQLLRSGGSADVNEVLKEGGRGSSSSGSHGRSGLRNSIVAVEVALALVLLVGAALMSQTFQHMLARNLGFDPKSVLNMDISLPGEKYQDAAQVTGFYERVLRGLETIPRVEAAAAAAHLRTAEAITVEGRPAPRPGEPRPAMLAVSALYFQALRIPIQNGRPIAEQDGTDAPKVVILSESLARRYWPNSNPVGQRIRLGNAQSPWLTVAGVAGDTRDWFTGESELRAYVSYLQAPTLSMSLMMRTTGDPTLLVAGARAQVRSADRNQPAYNVKTLEESLSEETSGVRSSAVTMGMYAMIALALAATGIYAVSAFFVAQRTHEMGLRMALGAGRGDILKLALGRSLRLALLGLAIGAPMAVLMTLAMSKALYNIVAVDIITVGKFTAVLALSAILAGYLPARRASKLDPLAALRNE